MSDGPVHSTCASAPAIVPLVDHLFVVVPLQFQSGHHGSSSSVIEARPLPTGNHFLFVLQTLARRFHDIAYLRRAIWVLYACARSSFRHCGRSNSPAPQEAYHWSRSGSSRTLQSILLPASLTAPPRTPRHRHGVLSRVRHRPAIGPPSPSQMPHCNEGAHRGSERSSIANYCVAFRCCVRDPRMS
jgi:hypothetical protein